MPESLRNFFEPRIGAKLDGVRLHDGPEAAASADALGARAYTVGTDVVFGRGEYRPETQEGTRVLAHELAHVVQQRERGVASVQRLVRPENVTCGTTGLTNPNLTGPQAIAVLVAADADAIALAQGAEDAINTNLTSVQGGGAVNAAFDTILQEELGLTLTNAAQFGLIEQQRNRFRRVRETLESGFLRYLCRANTVQLVGCSPAPCDPNFARSCPANRLMALCQAFWDDPTEQGPTLLHEPFHILFTMQFHALTALRRADASCFESFALRVAGRPAPLSCVNHTNG
ncbi:MAG TPA: DUF4157 domain-containing protein [Polyangiaceae bacterium]|nr:DUF4157 domain-containing protein [Polyangiaceae bacterium]